MTVKILRELFRHLQFWESIYETDRCENLTGPDGAVYNLHDIEYLYECRRLLSFRQRQAIELCLYDNIRERDAAERMGISLTNPVAKYATNGLDKIVTLILAGALPHYRPDDDVPAAENLAS